MMASCAVIVHYLLNRNVDPVDLQKSRDVLEGKIILKEMFKESYRLIADDSRGENIFYETWRLCQRVLQAIVATFFVDSLVRTGYVMPVITLITLSYRAHRPYKPEFYILHWMEVVFTLGFYYCLIQNMKCGCLFINNINDGDTVLELCQVSSILDLLFSPICTFLYQR